MTKPDPTRGKMHLGSFFHPTGHHVASWLHPGADADAGQNFRHYVKLAQMSEAAKFDLMFLADAVAVREGKAEPLSRWPQYTAYFEPLTLLSGLAAVTERIGLVATATISYNEPYNLARKYASLDLISGGRAGWNVVTSANVFEAFNFGREAHYAHGERYDRAEEFFDVVKGLWDSWDDDAFVRDRSTGRYHDPAKLHVLNHKGEHFSVRGPLNVARSPQGHPVIFQAGSSEAGRELAARTAEAVFAAAYTLEGAQAFYKDLKGRMAKYGRSPDHLKVMPGLNAIAGRTEREAREKHAYLQSLIHESVGLEVLSNALAGYDLAGLDPDGPLPEEVYSMVPKGSTTAFHNVIRWARDEKLTIRQMYLRFAGARGQRSLIGSASQIADSMGDWFLGRGVDGFLIQPSHLPGGLADFIELVIPELQERGLFRTEYEGTTLRENLGLPLPVSRYAR